MTQEVERAEETQEASGAPAEEGSPAERSTNPINNLHGHVSGAREAEIRRREAEMVELRVNGYSVRTIAAQYDIDPSRVSHIIGRALKQSVARPANELRGEMVAQIDRLIEAHARTALGLPRREGDEHPSRLEQLRATDVITRLLERRARLTGLDSIQLNVSDVSQEERAASLRDQVVAYMEGVLAAQEPEGATDTAAEAAGAPEGV